MKAENCLLEWDEWMMVDALITPKHTVVEFGARFGTTSCRLARATNNSGRVVAIEPDVRAIPALIRNREAQHCNFAIVNGTLGSKPLGLWKSSPFGYNQQTMGVSDLQAFRLKNPAASLPPLPHNLKVDEVEALIGSRINAALIDCEGCIRFALNDSALLERLELILIEEDLYKDDNPQWWERVVDYKAVGASLRAAGFTQIWRSHDTYDPEATAGWSRNMYHSAWKRTAHGHRHSPTGTWGRGAVNQCNRHADAASLNRSQLHCAPIPPAHEDKATRARTASKNDRVGWLQRLRHVSDTVAAIMTGHLRIHLSW